MTHKWELCHTAQHLVFNFRMLDEFHPEEAENKSQWREILKFFSDAVPSLISSHTPSLPLTNTTTKKAILK